MAGNAPLTAAVPDRLFALAETVRNDAPELRGTYAKALLCSQAASGQTAATPLISAMNSRRLTVYSLG